MKAYVTFDPWAILYGGYHLEQRIEEDFRRFSNKQLRAPKQTFPARSSRVIGFDTEYDPSGKLLTVGLADRDNAIALEVGEPEFTRNVERTTRQASSICGHSVEGDLDYLVKLNLAKEEWLRGERIYDSFLLARMYDENRGKGGYSLQAQFLSEFNFVPWKRDTEKLLKETGDASTWTRTQRTARCRLDAWTTRLLAEHLHTRVKAQINAVQEKRLT